MTKPRELTADDVVPAAGKPLGFLKVDVVRCMATREDGSGCRAPAKRGIKFCSNHKALAEKFPGDHPDRPKPEETAMVVPHNRTVAAQTLVEQLQEQYELAPSAIFAAMREGLQATTTRRQKKLDEDGRPMTLDEYGPMGGKHSVNLYEDVVEADHATRLAYMRELLDRLYGKPKARNEITGEGGGPVTVVGLVAHLAQLEAAQKTGDQQQITAYYEDIGEVEDAEVA